MRPAGVVPIESPVNPMARLGDRIIGMQIDLFILEGTPQALDEHVVAPGTPAIHADLAAARLDCVNKHGGGELATLAGVDDVRRTVAGERQAAQQLRIDRVPGIAFAGTRLRQVVHRPAADSQQFGLPGDAQLMCTVDHGFALTQLPNTPALVSTGSKKSFSSASRPILACSGAKSTGSSGALLPNTSGGSADPMLLLSS